MEMFQHGFMQLALAASLLIAVIAPILGIFLVLRRQSLLADTLSHVSLAGVALGLLINVNPSITTLIVVLIAAVAIEYMRTIYNTYSEISIAILTAAGLSIALILMNLNSGGTSKNVQQYLFGSIVMITAEQVRILLVIMVIILVLFVLFRRAMYVLTFDEDTAYSAGLPVKLMSLIFNVITGVTISVMMPIAGALLISAIMVLPAAIAMRLSKSFNMVIITGIIVGVIGMVGGLIGSYQFETPPGATVTLLFIIIFVLSALFLKIKQKMRRKA